ncbi:hypothetical protein EVAR_60889_1 [Eumeta japonica]|uniref:Reverse transcriptase domain-containing protein n=1 Tax=Eumeta variegata TaxID=151549 RepID=A0A4C1YJG6_EUMVA|nr:hypothetical protein EVAR_60889_1 [Eumeta japonica]
MVTAVHRHSEPQRNHHCVIGLLEGNKVVSNADGGWDNVERESGKGWSTKILTHWKKCQVAELGTIDQPAGGFTTFDMASGFHQIPIATNSVKETAFITPDGFFEYHTMPFGLCDAPSRGALNYAWNSYGVKTLTKRILLYVTNHYVYVLNSDEGAKRPCHNV